MAVAFRDPSRCDVARGGVCVCVCVVPGAQNKTTPCLCEFVIWLVVVVLAKTQKHHFWFGLQFRLGWLTSHF